MYKYNITLLEVGNSEAPNIGTIQGNSEVELVNKAVKALESHFDTKVLRVNIEEYLTFTDTLNSPPLNATVYLEEYDKHEIELQQTWIY